MEKAKQYIKNELRGGSISQSEPPSSYPQLHHQQQQQQQHQHHQQQITSTDEMISICYTCGAQGRFDTYSIRYKPNPDRPSEAYFPFLESHEPPTGVLPVASTPLLTVKSCYLCYVFLVQQWESFERDGKPYSQRVYALKRMDGKGYIGAEMSSQGEYAAQMLGLTAEHLVTAAIPPPQHTSRPISRNDSPHNKSEIYYQKRPNENHLNNGNGQTRPSSRNEKNTTPNPLSRPMSRESVTPNSQQQQISGGRAIYDSLPLKPSSFAQHKLKLGSINYANSIPSSNAEIKAANFQSQSQIIHQTEDGALDLRNSSSRGSDTPKSSTTPVSSVSLPNSTSHLHPAADILDLSMPDKNSITEVCYVCGDEYRRGSLMELSTVEPKEFKDEERPYFPVFNETHPRPARSRPKDPKGMIQACKPCYQHLLQQWQNFQVSFFIFKKIY